MIDRTADYYRQIRSLDIPAQTAKKLADGLAAGRGQLPPELQPVAKAALKAAQNPRLA